MADGFSWVDEKEKEIQEGRSKEFFNIVDGDNRFVLLSHCAPLAQVYDPATKKYRAAVEGDSNVSVKGVCWVYQEGVVKQARLPYVVVKQLRALQQNPDWDFTLPFPYVLTLNAVDAGTKEVKYTLTPSPKLVEIPAEILAEYGKKKSPEDIVELIKNGPTKGATPTQDGDFNDIPF